MDRTDVFRSLTLWFVAMIFLQTGSGASHPMVAVAALVAIALSYAVPLYLLAGIGKLLAT